MARRRWRRAAIGAASDRGRTSSGCCRIEPRWGSGFPFEAPAIAAIESLRLDAPITLLAGDNGTGKSTIVDGRRASRPQAAGLRPGKREPVVRDVSPYRGEVGELPVARADAGIAVDGAQPDGRPVEALGRAAVEVPAAIRAERLDPAAVRRTGPCVPIALA